MRATLKLPLRTMIGAPAAGLRWAGLGWAGLGVHWAGLRWAGLGWVALGWARVGWVGQSFLDNVAPFLDGFFNELMGLRIWRMNAFFDHSRRKHGCRIVCYRFFELWAGVETFFC